MTSLTPVFRICLPGGATPGVSPYMAGNGARRCRLRSASSSAEGSRAGAFSLSPAAENDAGRTRGASELAGRWSAGVGCLSGEAAGFSPGASSGLVCATEAEGRLGSIMNRRAGRYRIRKSIDGCVPGASPRLMSRTLAPSPRSDSSILNSSIYGRWIVIRHQLPAIRTLNRHYIAVNIGIGAIQSDCLNARFACVVCSHDQPQVSAELMHQLGEIRHSAANVFLHNEAVRNSESIGGRRAQLHEPRRALFRDYV